MNLLDQIIESGTLNTPPPLTSVLRQCIFLSSQLKVPVLRTWAEAELNGYSLEEKLPDYRIIPAGAFGSFQGFGIVYNSRPIPPAILEPQHRLRATEAHLCDPIGTFEAMDAKGELAYYWPGNLVAFYQDRLLEDCTLIQAWQLVPKSVIGGMLDKIRTRVLTTAIDIRTDFEKSGVEFTSVKQHSAAAQKAQQIVVNNILSGNNFYFASDITQHVQITNIEAGNWDSLRAALEKSGIDEPKSAELQGTLQHEKTMGEGVNGWIRRNAGKVAEKGLEVGTNVGAKILTDLISRYLGLPPSAG